MVFPFVPFIPYLPFVTVFPFEPFNIFENSGIPRISRDSITGSDMPSALGLVVIVVFCIPQCGTYRIVFEKNMTPLVLDIYEGGEHHRNQEDNDRKNNNLGHGR